MCGYLLLLCMAVFLYVCKGVSAAPAVCLIPYVGWECTAGPALPFTQ
jgi:tryptophan-rich sensory protein